MALFLNNIDLNGNQLIKPTIHPLGTAPTSAQEGQIYYDTGENALFVNTSTDPTSPTWVNVQGGDITGVTAGVGLDGGGDSGGVTLTVDFSDFSVVAPVNGDSLATLDSDGSTEQRTTIEALASLYAGNGLSATSSVMSVDADQSSQITAVGSLTSLDVDGVADISGLLTIQTGIVPNAQDGAYLGTTSLQWSDLFLADGAEISFGDNNEVKLTHVHNTGLTLSHTATGDDKPVVFQLKSSESTISTNEVIGSIEFAATDTSGTDATGVCAGIHAIATSAFTASSNPTKLVFTTGYSEAANSGATAKMILDSNGKLTVADDIVMKDGGTIGSATTVDAMTVSSDGIVAFKDNIKIKDGGTIGTATTPGAITIASDGNVSLSGDLTVGGTTTTVNSTTVAIADAMLKLASNQADTADALDFGFYGQYGVAGTAKWAGLFRDGSETGDPFTFFDGVETEPTTVVDPGATGYSLADIKVGGILLDSNTISGIDDSDEFTDDDNHIMTSAAINDRFALINADTTGTATNATNAAHVLVTDNESTSEENLITFVEDATSATGNVGLEMDGTFTYNPGSGTVTATEFKGNIDAVDGDFDGTLEADTLTINGTAIVAQATTSAVGGVELATAGEVQAGTDSPSSRVVTAATLAAKSVRAEIVVASLTGDNYVTVTHNLSTADVIVELYDKVTDQTVYADVYRTTDNLSTASTSVITIDFGSGTITNNIICLITSVEGATDATAGVAYT